MEAYLPHLKYKFNRRNIFLSKVKKQTRRFTDVEICEKKEKYRKQMSMGMKTQKYHEYLLNKIEEERYRLARDMHDGMAQELALLKLEILQLGKEFPRNQKPFHNKINAISKQIDTTVNSVRNIISELRPVLIDKVDLQAAIEWHVKEFQKLTGIKCTLAFNDDLKKLDKEHEIAVFRILQEILINVMHHADASKVKVSFKESDNQLLIGVKDNGKGINEEQLNSPVSFGIIGMNERVSILGGSLTIKGIQNKGTSISIGIPLHEKSFDGETC
jgi:signal transduction histidine kinase